MNSRVSMSQVSKHKNLASYVPQTLLRVVTTYVTLTVLRFPICKIQALQNVKNK